MNGLAKGANVPVVEADVLLVDSRLEISELDCLRSLDTKDSNYLRSEDPEDPAQISFDLLSFFVKVYSGCSSKSTKASHVRS